MSKELATRILDRVRDGAIYPEAVVTKALIATGDLEEPLY